MSATEANLTPPTAERRAALRRLVDSPWLLALAIGLLALLPRLTDLDVFVGPDEFSWVTRPAAFAAALASGDLAQTYQTEHPAVPLMWLEAAGTGLGAWLGGGDWAAVLDPPRTMAALAARRAIVAGANTVLLVGAVLLVRAIFGANVAWLTGLLVAFDPFILTESRALRIEGLVTGFNTLALLALLLYLKTRRLGAVALVGLLTGLALLSKISAVALLPVGGLVIGLTPLLAPGSPAATRWRQAVQAVLLWGGVILLTIFGGWPALWVAPGEVAQRMFGYIFSRAAGEGGSSESFFWGQALPDNADPGPFFYPVVLLYRTTPLLWAGLLALLPLIWPGRRFQRTTLLMIGVIGLYCLVYLAVITRAEIKFDRYTIPMLPALYVLAALGLVTAWRAWVGRWPGLARLGGLAAGLLLLNQVALAWPHHPYYYTYWNPLLGGIAHAVQVLPVGIGGEGLDQVAAYLNSLPNADQIKLASANSQKLRPLLKGQTLAMENLDGGWVQGDYALTYISQVQREKHAADILTYLARREPVYTLTLAGFEYGWLYPGPAAQFYGGGHKLEGRGTLFGYDLDRTELTAGETLAVTLYWRNEGQRESDRFFVRLMDVDGYVWAEAIAQPRPGFETAARTENEIVESEATLTLPPGMPPGEYFFKPGFRTDSGQIIGYFVLPEDVPRLQVSPSREPAAPVEPPQPRRLAVNGELELLGYGLSADTVSPAGELWLTLYWQAGQTISHDYVILLRLLDARDEELAFWLGRPVRSGYPTTEWQAGQPVQDPWRLTLPPEAGPGRYQLEIALFEAESQTEVARTRLGELVVAGE